MSIEYFELPGLEEIQPSDLVLPKSIKLYSAIIQNKEYELLQVLRLVTNGVTIREYLLVNVTCDEVPSIKANGLLYRERLALEVSNDESLLVDVIALRKDFPILLHQNQTRMGTPAQLCLYFDSHRNVSRTWTAQNFLKRIIWWIEKSSRGELHPADQPVEGLFFATRFELVLPWDFDYQRNNGTKFTFLKGPERPDKGMTFFAWDVNAIDQRPFDKIVDVIQLDLPAIVHNQVEQDPYTLGDLVDLFASKNIDLIELLQNSLKFKDGIVGDYTSDKDIVFILMHIPIKRDENSEPEGVTQRAFIIPIGPFQLGIDIGYLARIDNQVINDTLGKVDMGFDARWRQQRIDSLSVSYFSTPEKSRIRSGIINNSGPNGLLVGAGALGSAMLNLWIRSGWGTWRIVDNDYLKPHNLARHIGYAFDVGRTKVDLIAQHSNDVSTGAIKVEPLCIDATNLSSQELILAHQESNLVIDASTTLEYPRLASTCDDVSRHISAFITSDGNSSVLLAENSDRTIRLRTLEAQYYRGLINGSIGNHIINQSAGSFISGSSCRDISTIMPYSKIVNHASTLAEQIISASVTNSAFIRVWNRSEADASTSFHEIVPEHEICLSIDKFHIYLDKGLENKIRDIRTKAFPNETGGILLGYYDFNVSAIVIVDILPAPKDSIASPVSFERGVDGTKEQIQKITKLTGDMVGYIGEWHSHPPGSSANPSNDDYFQLIFLSLGMAEDGLPAISLIVGENDLQVLKCEVVK